MGIYLNPVYENFRRTLAADIYVDKTMTDFETKYDVFTYLMHVGYLAYQPAEETCRIPMSDYCGEQ